MTKLSDKKLELTAEKLHLEKVKTKKRKFIAIQMDGVPYHVLKKAMDKGYARFLKKIINEEGYHLTKWNCGLPSGTPAIHSGVFYGKNDHVPAFRFIDKKNNKYFSFAKPGHAKYLQENYFPKKGLLSGGASYFNHLHGGAERAILTMSAVSTQKRMKRVKESDLWLLLLLNPISLIRVLYYCIAELLLEILSFVWNFFTRIFTRKKGVYRVWMPFRRFFVESLFVELMTIGALVDMKRGVPKIYMTYINYDDMGHFRGPESAEAFFAIRVTSRRVKRLYKRAMKEGYDFYVLSDHGQHESIPFKALNGMDLAKFISKCTKSKSFGADDGERRQTVMRVAMKKTVDVVDYISKPLQWVLRGFAKSTIKLVRGYRYPFDWKNKKGIFVVDSCSLANVYFNFSKERVGYRAIEKRYPGLINKLLRNKGIGLVMVKNGKDTLLLGKGGKVVIGKDLTREGKDMLADFGDPKILLKQFKEYQKKHFLGDLVLFGAFNDGKCTSFTDHVGCHGGIGGKMMEPFFISKEHKDLTYIIDAKEMHKIFKKYM